MRILLWSASVLVLPVSILWWLGQLARHFSILRRADVVIIDPHMLNFGLNLIGIDIARRLFPDRNVVYFFSWEPGASQNILIGSIWTDITVLLLRRANFLITILGRSEYLPLPKLTIPLLGPLARVFLRLIAWKADIRLYGELFGNIPVPPELEDLIPHDYSMFERYGRIAQALWWSMANNYPSPPPTFPQHEKATIHTLLEKVRGGKSARLCMMHNKVVSAERAEGREGSNMAAYLPAIRMLVDEGCQVMLVGDKTLEDEMFDSFAGMVVDATRLGVDHQLFRLFAPLEAEICIGDGGSGLILPGIRGIPMLVLNAYPVAHIGGLGAKSWVYPKRHTDKATGKPIPTETIFRDDPFGCLVPPENKPFLSQPHPNTEEEITEAVRCFLADLAHPVNDDPGGELIELLPRESGFRISGARLSPAFVRHNRAEKNQIKSKLVSA